MGVSWLGPLFKFELPHQPISMIRDVVLDPEIPAGDASRARRDIQHTIERQKAFATITTRNTASAALSRCSAFAPKACAGSAKPASWWTRS